MATQKIPSTSEMLTLFHKEDALRTEELRSACIGRIHLMANPAATESVYIHPCVSDKSLQALIAEIVLEGWKVSVSPNPDPRDLGKILRISF